MENIFFLFTMFLSLSTVAYGLFYFLLISDPREEKKRIKSGFKLLSDLTRVLIFLHGVVIGLGFVFDFDLLKGRSLYFVLCLSLFALIFLYGKYIRQRIIFKSKKYLFKVEKVRDSDIQEYNLKGYILQDSRKYRCQMRGNLKHKAGDRIEVQIIKMPTFGAFIVGEDWDL